MDIKPLFKDASVQCDMLPSVPQSHVSVQCEFTPKAWFTISRKSTRCVAERSSAMQRNAEPCVYLFTIYKTNLRAIM